MKYYISSIILVVLLSGCGTTGKVFRYEDGVKNQLYEMHLDTQGAMTYKDKDVEIQIDSRKPTAWERFISPVIKGASGTTTEVN